jgi:hypothetical protein
MKQVAGLSGRPLVVPVRAHQPPSAFSFASRGRGPARRTSTIPTGDARGWSGRSSNCPSSSRNYACAASLNDGSIELSRHPSEHVEGPLSRLCHGSGPPETSRSPVGLIGYRPVSQTESRQSITVTSSLERRQFRLAHLPAASWPIGPSGAAGMTLQVLDNTKACLSWSP